MIKYFLAVLSLFAGLDVVAQECSNPSSDSTPFSRYRVSPNGLVTDSKTGLIWRRCSEGQFFQGNSCKGEAKKMSLADTQVWIKQLNQGPGPARQEFADWRLPTQDELLSLASSACTDPAINLKAFPTTIAAPYLTSTTGSGGAGGLWVVDFKDGFDGLIDQRREQFVRLVRKQP